MMQDYDGADVFDVEGNKIGHVERTYVDGSRVSSYVEIKMGTLFSKHRLVPLKDAEPQKDGLHLPLSRAVIEGSPDVSSLGDGVDAETLSMVESYYDGGANESDTTAEREGAEDTSDQDEGGSGPLDRVGGAIHRSAPNTEDTPVDPMGGQTHRETGAPVASSAATEDVGD